MNAFADAVGLGNAMSDVLAGARPERWAALHWPGALREQLLTDEEAFTRIAGPLGEAYGSLLRARRPAGVVTDSLLAEGALDSARFFPRFFELRGGRLAIYSSGEDYRRAAKPWCDPACLEPPEPGGKQAS